MNMDTASKQAGTTIISENAELRSKLAEYEELLAAIRSGEIDGLVVSDENGQRLSPFEQFKNVYRQLVERMGEGALILSDEGIILYANQIMAKILQAPLQNIIGSRIYHWLPSSEVSPIRAYIKQLTVSRNAQTIRSEHILRTNDGQPVAVYLALNADPDDDHAALNLVVIVTDLSEQKRNQAIAADERLARAILDQAADAIVICDETGIVIRASAPAQRLCDHDPVGHPFEHCFPLCDESGRRYTEKEIVALGNDKTGEKIFVHVSRHHQLQVSAALLYNPDSAMQPLGSVISLKDITSIKLAERNAIIAQEQIQEQLDIAKRARKALLNVVEDVKASDERLRKIASRLPGMVYQYQRHPDGRHSMPYASGAITEIFRLSADAVKHDVTKLFDIIHPDDLNRTIKSINESADGLTPWRHEFRVRYDDGTVRWLFGNSVPQQQDDGSILWHGFITDITDRKSTEAKVKLAANVFKQSREGIFITDADNNIIMLNDAFTQITGYTESETLGHNPGLLSSDRQSKDFYRDMWHTIDSTGFWEGEIWNRRKDGSVFPEWLSITRTYDDDGRPAGHIGIFDDITQRKEYEQHIQWLAHYDSMTQLPNRALLHDRMQTAISMATRKNTQLAVLFCDLDNFKNVNDALGHNIGDKLLLEVARRLQSSTRNEDTVSRQGGDEFIILLQESGPEGAAHVAEKIQAMISLPYTIDSYEMTISLSIGIAIFPDDGGNFDTLARNADIAMYRAKNLGRKNYCFYTPELERSTARGLKLEKDIHKAIDNNELEVYYQPQNSLVDGSISGVEALLRWNHPEFGMVSPFEFIPVAENSGEILRIGEWVTRTATQQMKDWLDSGIEPVKLSVNLSVRELRQPQLAEKLKTILDEVGFNPHYLELEITESMLMEDQENVIRALHLISALGIQLSIDDFGTGYSSLSYLKSLPVDQLKIDKIFVQDMLSNHGNAIIACSVITLGHSLGLNVIAEGVEESEQLDFLRANRCDNMQGYLFSKPLPADQVTGILTRAERLPIAPDTKQSAEAATLLVVDNEPGILSAIGRVLSACGHDILTAASGEKGLDLIISNKVGVIISDEHITNISGSEFLIKAKSLCPDAVHIVISSYPATKSIMDSVIRGDIHRYLPKPLDDDVLRDTVREAFQRHEIIMQKRGLEHDLRVANSTITQLRKV